MATIYPNSLFAFVQNQKTLYKIRKYRQDLRSPKTIENNKILYLDTVSSLLFFNISFSICHGFGSLIWTPRAMYDYSLQCSPGPPSSCRFRLPSGLPSVRISLLAATLPSSLTCHPLFCSASPFSSYPDPAPSLSRCDPHFLFIRVLFHPIFPSFRPLPVPPFHLAAAFLPTSLLPVLPGPILNSSFRYPCNDTRPCPCL